MIKRKKGKANPQVLYYIKRGFFARLCGTMVNERIALEAAKVKINAVH